MSFNFNWRFFDVADLQARTKETVTESIAQTRRPPVIAAPIRAVDVNFGTQPPDLAFQAIPVVSLTRTHIVFHLKYSGDASLTLDTAIEANPLREPLLDANFSEFVKPRIIAALDRLVLPFRLKLHNIVLDTLIDVVYTPHGVVVNFHDNPVKRIQVESSLDMLPGVNAMISTVLKHQLTMSFYEDIPESVWASTSPTKTPPDPFYGARRWSRHLSTFLKFAPTFLPTLGPVSRPKFTLFNTLALNTQRAPNLNPPITILNRGCLRSLRARRVGSPPVNPDHVNQFLTDDSSIPSNTSQATSMASKSSHKRPRRRVISLRGIINKMEQPKEKSPKSEHNSPVSPPKTPQPIHEEPPSRIPSLRIPNTPFSSRHINGTYSNPQSTPQTPELQSTGSAVADDIPFEPMLPPQWDRRRFSTPTQHPHRALRVPKNRSTSMQPSKTTQPRTPSILRSPGGRIASTNDLR